MINRSTGSAKRRRAQFVEEFLKDFNATAAYIRAGYTTNRSAAGAGGYKLLRHPEVAGLLAARAAGQLSEAQVDGQRVIQEWTRIAFGDIREMFDAGGMLINPTHLSDRVAAAIESIDFVQRPGQGAVVTKVKRYDKLRALEGLAKYFGLLKDAAPPPQWNFDPATLAKMSDEDLAKALEYADKVQAILAGKP